MSDLLSPLIEQVKSNDFRALAKLLTYVDRHPPKDLLQHSDLLTPTKTSLRVGITGPPGAGKSTLIGGLITELRKQDYSVGVIAVDPSSPFTKGAILGDRVRYSEHFEDDKVFIRSIGTRGSLGGLSASTYLMLRAFDLANFDVILIETVGVGQTELEIIHVADFIAVVMVPESGDSIQAMKAGLLEVADLYIVNKSDRPGADSFANSLNAYAGSHDNPIRLIKTTASENIGLDLFCQEITKKMMESDYIKNRTLPQKLQNEAKSLSKYQLELQLQEKLSNIQSPKELSQFLQNEINIESTHKNKESP